MRVDLDVSIHKKEAELEPLLLRMEELRLQFVDDTTHFAAEWFEQKALEYATKKPEVTLRLGKEQLAGMKAQVNGLARNAGNIVSAALSDLGAWWHKTPRVNQPVALYEQLGNDKVGNKFPEVLDKLVRRALGELGNILEQYGYGVTTGAIAASYPEFWFERNSESGAIRPFFPHLFEWSEKMQDTIMRYDAFYKRAIVVFEEITLLKEEKKRQEAAAVWNSV
jgi:predicted DNA binding CopG/RHH family protein